MWVASNGTGLHIWVMKLIVSVSTHLFIGSIRMMAPMGLKVHCYVSVKCREGLVSSYHAAIRSRRVGNEQ